MLTDDALQIKPQSDSDCSGSQCFALQPAHISFRSMLDGLLRLNVEETYEHKFVLACRQAHVMLVHCQQNLGMGCAADCKAAASQLQRAKKQLSQQLKQATAHEAQAHTVSRQLFVLPAL